MITLFNQLSVKEAAKKEETKEKDTEEEEEEEEEPVPGSTLFIKNLNFSTAEDKLQEVGTLMNTTF